VLTGGGDDGSVRNLAHDGWRWPARVSTGTVLWCISDDEKGPCGCGSDGALGEEAPGCRPAAGD
jgi:hypothetical protein